jgi:hypothetical protein
MFYCHGVGWTDDFPRYVIKEALSKDGIRWTFSEKILIGNPLLDAVSRPCVIKKNNQHIMWFAKKQKNTNYKIEAAIYANSQWSEYNSNLHPSKQKNDWDYDMTCYPFVLEKNMFYNGNGYGNSGIGVASWIGE